MSSTPVPARLHVILARDSAQAIVIRRGPAKQVAIIGWNRESNEFTLGQWLKGYIYTYYSDLSPDGQYFIYFAKDNRSTHSWTAVSKVPYLKALDFYRKKDTWSWGGGLFFSNKTYFLNETNFKLKKIFRRSGLIMALKPVLENNIDYYRLGTYLIRLQRDGWIEHSGNNIQTAFGKPKFRYSKEINNWTLHKLIYNEIHTKEQGKNGGVYERHQLIMENQIIEYPDWEWADIDGNRIVWAEKGKLMTGKLDKSGLHSIKELYDFNAMQFEERISPY